MPRNAVQVVFRYWVICLFFALFPYGLPAVLAGVLTLQFLAFVAFLVAVGFNFVQWLGHRVLFGGSEDYEKLRANGLDPWFDVSCPFRSESEQVSLTADEPEIRWFCRNCGAEVFDPDMPCRSCGYEPFECGNCGSPVENEFARCAQCGNHPLR